MYGMLGSPCSKKGGDFSSGAPPPTGRRTFLRGRRRNSFLKFFLLLQSRADESKKINSLLRVYTTCIRQVNGTAEEGFQ